MEILEARVIQKVGTEAEWLANPLVLLDGEAAIVRTGDGTPVNLKFGDGGKTFAELPYFIDYSQAAYIAYEATPTQPIAYTFVGEGTYGAITVAEGYMAVLGWDGTSWSKNAEMELPQTEADAGLNLDDNKPLSGNTAGENDLLVKGTIDKVNAQIYEIGEFESVSGNSSNGAIYKDGTLVPSGLSTGYRRTSVTSETMFIVDNPNDRYYYTGEIRNILFAGVIFQDENHNYLGYDCSAYGIYVDRELKLPAGTKYIGATSLTNNPIIRKRKFKSKLTDINSINGNLPFIKNATFVSDNPASLGQDRSWVKTAVKGLKLYGLDINKKYSPYVITRNSSGLWRIEIWEDSGTGDGVNKTRVLRWDRNSYSEPSGIDVIEHYEGTKGFKIYIDWSLVPVGSNGGITYNAGGLDLDALINFSTSSDTPQSDEYELSWQYNNVDATTTGTSLYKQFTLVPNRDSDNDVLGCTGASYNKDTDEFVISYYSFAKASKLWFYKRSDLVDYSPTGTIIPVPTREIDLSSYLYHIQGNVYDPETKTYWVLGSLNAVSIDEERVLIRVDDEGNQLERYLLSSYSFQAGMLALSPDLKNLLIKPNNKNWLLEIDKSTKEQVRQVTVSTANEGLGVDYKNKFVWLGGDSGNLYKYRYSDMALLQTIPYESLPSGGTQNIEGLIVDIDGALLNIADAYLHGTNNNGNCMWVYDFDKTIDKYLFFPSMFKLNLKIESPVFDFNGFSNIQNALISNGSGTIEYRGSNTAPTFPIVERKNWRDLPFAEDWGSTTPSAWSTTRPSTRYIQLRVV